MSRFDHLIVLMLENRSFDHMFGFLDHPSARFPRLAGTEACRDEHGVAMPVRVGARYEIPSPDHSHAGIMHQLGAGAAPPYRPTNSGFVTSFGRRVRGGGARIMQSFHPRMIPVLSTLAREYAVCTRWFCSVPGETWPNRDFAHTGTSRGKANIAAGDLWSTEKTVFELLEDAGQSWRIYHDSTPHTWNYTALTSTLVRRGRFQDIGKLYTAIRDDQLPAYAFVEPDFGDVAPVVDRLFRARGNSQHPGQADSRDEFIAGELLIHRIYDALRRKPDVFEKTILLITYDEHGGFYDHVPPPAATPPDARRHGTFAFDLLGARVPAVIVSPWIERGTIDDTVYDHTSIIQTVRSRFAPGRPALGRRDAVANVFRQLVQTRATPRRGSEVPATRPLSGAEAAALERQLAIPLPVDELPDVEEGEDTFRAALRELSAGVGAMLTQESPLESVGFDAGDPEQVLLQFRASAEDAGERVPPATRARLREAAMPRAAGGGGGFERAGGFEVLGPPILETPDAPAALGPEKALVERVLAKLRDDQVLELAEIGGFEAIVLLDERPVIDVVERSFATPPSPWQHLAREPARAHLERAITCVGRLDVPALGGIPYAGTGFLVGDGLVMTNRHVAGLFARGVGARALVLHERATLDLERESDERKSATPLTVTEVVLVHPHWDLALLRVDGAPAGRALTLRAIAPDALVGREIAAIGYPARDPKRNDVAEQDRIFRSLYQIKRLSPGRITDARRDVALAWGSVEAMVHDCSTLGGNSGSCLVDIATGDVVGLHLGGRYLQANFACPAYELKRDPRLVDAGVRFSDDPVPQTPPAWLAAWGDGEIARAATQAAPAVVGPTIAIPAGAPGSTVRVRIPIELTITVGTPTPED